MLSGDSQGYREPRCPFLSHPWTRRHGQASPRPQRDNLTTSHVMIGPGIVRLQPTTVFSPCEVGGTAQRGKRKRRSWREERNTTPTLPARGRAIGEGSAGNSYSRRHPQGARGAQSVSEESRTPGEGRASEGQGRTARGPQPVGTLLALSDAASGKVTPAGTSSPRRAKICPHGPGEVLRGARGQRGRGQVMRAPVQVQLELNQTTRPLLRNVRRASTFPGRPPSYTASRPTTSGLSDDASFGRDMRRSPVDVFAAGQEGPYRLLEMPRATEEMYVSSCCPARVPARVVRPPRLPLTWPLFP